MTGLGALLVILAGFAAGAAAARELRSALHTAEDMIGLTEQMRTSVCLRRQPLPAAIQELERHFPQYFGGALAAASRLENVPFKELWTALVRAMHLPAAIEATILELGRELAGGEIPELVFEKTLCALQEERRALQVKQKEKTSVYLALGTGGGVMLCLLLV